MKEDRRDVLSSGERKLFQDIENCNYITFVAVYELSLKLLKKMRYFFFHYIMV